jgi:hypothetical protein
MKPHELLRQAALILADGWSKNTNARDDTGRIVPLFAGPGRASIMPSEAAARLESGTGTTTVITQQIANRSIKSDRLPIKQAKPRVNDKAPLRVPAQITPNPKFKTDCKPPIDILGRCFADARVNHK